MVLQQTVSGCVPEIRIPVRKRDSPDFNEFRRLSLASTDIEENPASGVCQRSRARDPNSREKARLAGFQGNAASSDGVLGVSGRVPEIRIPVRKRDSPDFKVTRQARTGYSVDASVTTSTGYC
ncbi:uncharacterized protein MEPE_02003 [Melanopsichium pennsylvanicum]|uniref:Uncharacterized protein n=1 Tax=Melanopsichium pennsylvanicum TaxID=63383 RepID=A0AAJ5C444_9BASI|nr:uncharacterized protein MEPE_02003 [Melanopsichium pennsylvanicum]